MILQTSICAYYGGCGSFGIRTKTHQCVGFEISSGKITNILPIADIDFKILSFHFNYFVKEDCLNCGDYCLGQDIWYGE